MDSVCVGGWGDECICIPWALTRWVAINNLSLSYGCVDVRQCLVVGIRKQMNKSFYFIL